VANRCARLLLRTIDTFAVADASRLHLDLTAIRSPASYPDSDLIARGWAGDALRPAESKPCKPPRKPAFVYFPPTQGSSNELPAFISRTGDLGSALPLACSQSPTPAWATWPTSAPGRRRHPFRRTTACRHGWAHASKRSDASLDTLPTLDHTAAREQHYRKPAHSLERTPAPFPVTAKDTHNTTTSACLHPLQPRSRPVAAAGNAP